MKMNIKCRACLATTEAKMYHSLLTVFPEYTNTNLRVLDLLGIVTLTTLDISCGLPDAICTACLKQLKDSYKFIRQFKDAQLWLQKNHTKDLNDKSEQIIIEFDPMDKRFTSPVIFDSEEGDIFLDNVTINKHRNKSEDKSIVKQVTESVTKVRKKRNTIKRPLKSNEDGFIVMSIEDVLQDEESLENHLTDNRNNLEENKEDVITHIDHSYQKTFKISHPNRHPFLMSINDVCASTTESREIKTNITQSTDPVENRERKRTLLNRRKAEEQEVHTFMCDICLKVYDSHRKLIIHKWNVHIPADSQCKCPICGVICRTRSAFNHHKLKHKGKRYSCDECDKSYLTPSQRREHKRSKHGDKSAEKYLCNTCGLQFKFKATLRYHLVSKHSKNNRMNMCQYCDFRCIQKSYLKRHERCHTDERPYKCKYCDKRFRGSGELGLHQLSHEGKYKYACKYCAKGFLTTWNMKVHWFQHGGNYGCEICNRSFIDMNVLKFHYIQQHKIRDDENDASENITNNYCEKKPDHSDAIFYQSPTTAEDLFIPD